jgi:HD-like signal output (HDOD) protein
MPSQVSTSELLGSLVLPAMPESLRQIRAEQARAVPDVERITAIIAEDVGLAAEVLKTINSPMFRRRQPLGSVPNAVMLLGLDNVLNIVASVALRRTMDCGDNRMSLNRFWDTAGDVAFAIAALARRLSGVPADTAYTLGLFHDCGIPIMMCRYPDYLDTLKTASRPGAPLITGLERERHGIHHAVVGAHVSRSWLLPEAISAAILHHHELPQMVADEAVDEMAISLIALLKMAEHISNRFRGAAFRSGADDQEWEAVGIMALSHFDIDPTEFSDLSEDIVEELGGR